MGNVYLHNVTYVKSRMKQKILYSIAIGGGYAITDELHQFFVSGRSAQVLDVVIDTSGVIVGVLIYLVLRKLIKLVINKNNTKVV